MSTAVCNVPPSAQPLPLEEVQRRLLACRDCASLFGHTPSPVVQGAATAKILQISQAPSYQVHCTHKPFNDASGRRLKQQWYAISDDLFYSPHLFYIASLGHCYPGKSKHGGDNPPPPACAKKWLPLQLAALHPQLIIIVGAMAAKFFFPGIPFSQLVFQDHTVNGCPAFVLPHPSPLNNRWLKSHPQFQARRIPHIRSAIHRVLALP